MDQLTPSIRSLLMPLAPCFRPEVFSTFCLMPAAWVVCLGRRTISRVWETTGLADRRCHCPAFRLFSDAAWNFDDLARILLVRLLAVAVPGTRIWLVVDDTLCHKRGVKVACAGIYLDPVLSSKRHKVFRYGLNWVTLGLIIQLPFRADRPFCVNLLWRLARKKGDAPTKEHLTKPQLARQMIDVVARWLPNDRLVVVGDCAYMVAAVLKGLPEHVGAIGPIHRKAVLTRLLPEGYRGCRKKGDRFTTPTEALAGEAGPWQRQAEAGRWRGVTVATPRGEKRLRVRVLGPCCWYASVKGRPLRVVLVRDPARKDRWRDEALLCTDPGLSAGQIVEGYLKRWQVEVAYAESKQQMGLHDPMVYSEPAVRRAHPMAWFVGGLVVLWYVQGGHAEAAARRQRPWYEKRAEPTFADMLGACRLHLWRDRLDSDPDDRERKVAWFLEYAATAA